jgi:Fe-S-cluster containining protein
VFNTEHNELPESAPDLCHKCGRCCVSATTFHSHKTLLEKAASGEIEAQEFLRVFTPFPSLDEARKVVPEQVDNIIDVVTHRDDMALEDLTIYYCQHVTEEGLCGIYETRPRCCKDAPGNGFSAMPPGCGYEGWQFLQREKIRSDIRKLKEMHHAAKTLSPDGIHTPSGDSTLLALAERVAQVTQAWKRHGVEFW